MKPRETRIVVPIQNRGMCRICALLLLTVAAGGLPPVAAAADSVPTLTIKAGEATRKVSPRLYGLMTEEINYSYDGGLYGELINNRTFHEGANNMRHWELAQDAGAAGSVAVDATQPLNEFLTNSLKLEITAATGTQRVGIANGGYWGIPVWGHTRYKASFYAKAANGFSGHLTVAIVGTSNATVYAGAKVSRIGPDWKKYEVTLKTGDVPTSKDNRLVILADAPGTVWFSVVSLFPPTFNHRANGNRKDIMALLGDMKPAFLRFPGGNYLEGNTFATRFDWKKTIHDISRRPGHQDDAWRYWSTDGMGLLEFLEWCEDLHMEPVLAIYAGYSMRSGGVAAGPELDPYVKEGLEEIEYVTGDKHTTWGAQRAADGHPAPFKLAFVEIGNEDNLGSASRTYGGRFAAFYDAIKAKYPGLQVIATARVTNRVPDLVDEHYYRGSELDMESHAHDYDNRPRTTPTKVFVGEWATRIGRPTPNLGAALGDAAWMVGMERNSDLVLMASYAPLFVNVNPGGMQWPTDLIGYDTLSSYGSPSYYAQKIFSRNHGDVVLSATAEGVPTREYQPPAGRRRGGTPPPAREVPTMFFDATRDTRTKMIYVKIVNSAPTPQDLHVEITGVKGVKSRGQAIVLSGNSPEDTNSIKEPRHIVPVTSKVDGLGAGFTRTFPAYSITILELQGT